LNSEKKKIISFGNLYALYVLATLVGLVLIFFEFQKNKDFCLVYLLSLVGLLVITQLIERIYFRQSTSKSVSSLQRKAYWLVSVLMLFQTFIFLVIDRNVLFLIFSGLMCLSFSVDAVKGKSLIVYNFVLDKTADVIRKILGIKNIR